MRIWEVTIKETNSSMDLENLHVLGEDIQEALKIAGKLIKENWKELLEDLKKKDATIEVTSAKAVFDIDVPEVRGG